MRNLTSTATPETADERLDVRAGRWWAAAAVVGTLMATMAVGLLRLPAGNDALPAAARQALTAAVPFWHTTEPVNEIVYGTRGFDTFGETFLLFAAVVSITVLGRPREPRRERPGEAAAGRQEQREDDPTPAAGDEESRARRAEGQEEGRPDGQQESGGQGPAEGEHDPAPATPDARPLGGGGVERARGMTVPVRVAARLVAPVLTVVALYVCAWGYSPGGGFPAGAALAGVVILLYAAFGLPRLRRVLSQTRLETVEAVGALVIVTVEVLGLVLRGSVSANFLPLGALQTIRSGGILQVFSVGELLEVGTGVLLAVIGLLSMGHDWTGDESGPRR